MNKEALKAAIVKIIKMIILDPHDNEAQKDTFVNDYLSYIDSIRFIELITEVENEFGIEISNEDLILENIKDLDSFVTMISKYVNADVKIMK
ncbi:acyl carrier protein [Anaerocolumna jejuensis]|uniref:acyl carrier protein n=1 Tax=Anaerocolumna jejuensis TaxID=259063 RepID=UPI003F7BA299